MTDPEQPVLGRVGQGEDMVGFQALSHRVVHDSAIGQQTHQPESRPDPERVLRITRERPDLDTLIRLRAFQPDTLEHGSRL